MYNFSKKGSIFIAMMFAIALSIAAASFFRATRGAGRLALAERRTVQGYNCAVAGMYEALNRIRVNPNLAPWETPGWNNPTTINIVMPDPTNMPATYIVPASVTFINTAVGYTINSTVDYDDIRI